MGTKEKVYKLIGSAGSLEQLTEAINTKFYYGSKKEYRFFGKNIYGVFFPQGSPKAGQQLSGVRIIQKGNRFRFEILV